MNLKTFIKVFLCVLTLLGANSTVFAQQDPYMPPQVSDTSAEGKRALAINRMVFRNNPPTPKAKVNDWEKILTPQEEQALDSLVIEIKKATNVDIAILTLDTICMKTEKFMDISSRIADKWGVGKKLGKNGLLLSFSAGHRLSKIENGFGEERLLTEQNTTEILARHIYPRLAEGKYYEALAEGLAAISQALSQHQ